jgi:hypothetical protein
MKTIDEQLADFDRAKRELKKALLEVPAIRAYVRLNYWLLDRLAALLRSPK